MNPKAVKLDTVPQEGKSLEFVIPVDRVEHELNQRGVKGVLVGGGLEVSATVLKSGPDVFVLGKFSVPVKVTCVRCLEEFTLTVGGDVHLDLTTEPIEYENTSGEFELSAAELEVDHISGDEIDLEEIFIEQFILNIPEYPVCKENCVGLCPACGKKLGEGACDCGKSVKPSPFSVLAGLKTKK